MTHDDILDFIFPNWYSLKSQTKHETNCFFWVLCSPFYFSELIFTGLTNKTRNKLLHGCFFCSPFLPPPRDQIPAVVIGRRGTGAAGDAICQVQIIAHYNVYFKHPSLCMVFSSPSTKLQLKFILRRKKGHAQFWGMFYDITTKEFSPVKLMHFKNPIKNIRTPKRQQFPGSEPWIMDKGDRL